MAPSLILIGFMGSGKSAVGRELAARLGWQFRDADRAIEERAGVTIAEIFAGRGEPEFRRLEEETVLDLLQESEAAASGRVISLGGGAVTSERLRDRLAQEPLVALLESDLETAYRRSQDGKRPLAKDHQRFKELYEERQPLYRSVAKIRIDTRGRNIVQVAADVMGAIGQDTGKGGTGE